MSSVFPTTGLLDNFDRADGDPGANWTDGTAVWPAWESFRIVSNELANQGAAGTAAGFWSTSFGLDQEAYLTITVVDAAKMPQLWVRASGNFSTLNLYAAGPNPSADSYAFTKKVNGSDTLLGVAIFASRPVAGEKIGLHVRGTDPVVLTLYLWRSDTWNELGSRADYVNPHTSGSVGLIINASSTIRVDDFGGGDSTLVPAQEIETQWPDPSSGDSGGGG